MTKLRTCTAYKKHQYMQNRLYGVENFKIIKLRNKTPNTDRLQQSQIAHCSSQIAHVF